MGSPRELIAELIGEEDTERYFNGERIEIKGLHYAYIIERKRGYADIVRNRVESDGWYDPKDGYRRRNVVATASGRIRAWNIDDAVASFIVAARTDNVNWACGNMDVRLPSTMPPKDAKVTTFITRGFATIYYEFMRRAEIVRDLAVGDTVGDTVLALGVWWIANFALGMGVVLLTPKNADGSITLAPLWRTYLGFTLVYAFPLYILLVIIKYYFVWKKEWEVKMA